MRIRLKFQKYGSVKFIGHLDVMRYFQKAFRRAGLDSEYSKGFNSHQIMSFAAPLGLGLTSDGEYMDIRLHTSETPKRMLEKINNMMSEGFYVTGFRILDEPGENEKNVTAMSLVSSADYLVSLKDGYSLGDKMRTPDKFQEAFEAFYSKTDITINKKTKKSEMDVNIRPMITLTAFDDADYKAKLKETVIEQTGPADNCCYLLDKESRADIYENNIRVYMQLDTGSVANLKPELVMEAFCKENQIAYNPFAWQVHRLEIYTREEENNKIIPLLSAYL